MKLDLFFIKSQEVMLWSYLYYFVLFNVFQIHFYFLMLNPMPQTKLVLIVSVIHLVVLPILIIMLVVPKFKEIYLRNVENHYLLWIGLISFVFLGGLNTTGIDDGYLYICLVADLYLLIVANIVALVLTNGKVNLIKVLKNCLFLICIAVFDVVYFNNMYFSSIEGLDEAITHFYVPSLATLFFLLLVSLYLWGLKSNGRLNGRAAD